MMFASLIIEAYLMQWANCAAIATWFQDVGGFVKVPSSSERWCSG